MSYAVRTILPPAVLSGGCYHPMATETAGDYPSPEEERAARTLMDEINPETWDPEPDPDYYKSGTVNIWDPIEGEGFNEPGHWADRVPDMDSNHARRLALRGEFDGLGEHQPLPLLRSNMRGVPTEGVQGTFAHVIGLSEPCPECAQSWGVAIHYTMPGEVMEKCLICGAEIGGSL